MPPAGRGASAAERCRQTDALSVVRKSRNSSGGLYGCRRRSAQDRPRANAMRFLMKTLRTRPASHLIHGFRQNPLWIRTAALLSSCRLRSPAWAIWVTGSVQIGLMDLLQELNLLIVD